MIRYMVQISSLSTMKDDMFNLKFWNCYEKSSALNMWVHIIQRHVIVSRLMWQNNFKNETVEANLKRFSVETKSKTFPSCKSKNVSKLYELQRQSGYYWFYIILKSSFIFTNCATSLPPNMPRFYDCGSSGNFLVLFVMIRIKAVNVLTQFFIYAKLLHCQFSNTRKANSFKKFNFLLNLLCIECL